MWGTSHAASPSIVRPPNAGHSNPLHATPKRVVTVSQITANSNSSQRSGGDRPNHSLHHSYHKNSVSSYASRISAEDLRHRMPKPPPFRPNVPAPPARYPATQWRTPTLSDSRVTPSYSHYPAYSYPQTGGQSSYNYRPTHQSTQNPSAMPSELYWQQQQQNEPDSGYYRAPIDPTYAASSHPLVRSNHHSGPQSNPTTATVKQSSQFTQRTEDRERLNSFLNSNPGVRNALAAALEPTERN